MKSKLSGKYIHGLPEEIICGVAVKAINNNRLLVTPRRITKYSISGKPEETFANWLPSEDESHQELSELVKLTGAYLSKKRNGSKVVESRKDPMRLGIIKILEERGVPEICEPGTWMESKFESVWN